LLHPTPANVITTVFMALRNIAEDCSDSDFNSRLHTKRRAEILQSLNANLTILLQRLYSFMSKTFEGRDSNTLAADVLRAAMQMIRRLLQWIAVDMVFQPERSFMGVFTTLALQVSRWCW